MLGAEPLFFLDYLGTGKLEPRVFAAIIRGFAQACRENHCALIGGETAQMPRFYQPGEYDVSGTIVGVVEKKRPLDGRGIRAGDAVIGLASTGLLTNGYSLARKLLFDIARYTSDTYLPELDSTIGDELLKIHRSYLRPIQALLKRGLLSGAAHITGGGITDNTPRILPKGLAAEVRLGSWPVLPVFELLRRLGNVERLQSGGDLARDDFRVNTGQEQVRKYGSVITEPEPERPATGPDATGLVDPAARRGDARGDPADIGRPNPTEPTRGGGTGVGRVEPAREPVGVSGAGTAERGGVVSGELGPGRVGGAGTNVIQPGAEGERAPTGMVERQPAEVQERVIERARDLSQEVKEQIDSSK